MQNVIVASVCVCECVHACVQRQWLSKICKFASEHKKEEIVKTNYHQMIIRSSTTKTDATKEHTRHTHTLTHTPHTHTHSHTDRESHRHVACATDTATIEWSQWSDKGKRGKTQLAQLVEEERHTGRSKGERRGEREMEKCCCYCYGHFVLETIIKHKQRRQTNSVRRWRRRNKERARETTKSNEIQIIVNEMIAENQV